MPIFEYTCPACSQIVDKLSLKPEHQVPACPHCLCPMTLKLATFQIRGPFRWYKASDYGRAGR